MKMKNLFHIIKSISLLLLTSFNFVNPFLDVDIANTAVWLSGASYCGKENYKSMRLSGPAKNFQVTDVLYDSNTDLQGYIGVLKQSKIIYIVFRGSSSKLNWMADFEVIRTPYYTYPECECSVHKGFYKATTNLKDKTVESLKKLKMETGFSRVIVTGHSLGAAIAQLIGMELNALNIINDVYNFGQPRIGNEKYARFLNKIKLNLNRFTHNKDVVPHTPPRKSGYQHSCMEIFEDSHGNLNKCSQTDCEDPLCSNQYSMTQTNTQDHSFYLGHYLDCGNSTFN